MSFKIRYGIRVLDVLVTGAGPVGVIEKLLEYRPLERYRYPQLTLEEQLLALECTAFEIRRVAPSADGPIEFRQVLESQISHVYLCRPASACQPMAPPIAWQDKAAAPSGQPTDQSTSRSHRRSPRVQAEDDEQRLCRIRRNGSTPDFASRPDDQSESRHSRDRDRRRQIPSDASATFPYYSSSHASRHQQTGVVLQQPQHVHHRHQRLSKGGQEAQVSDAPKDVVTAQLGLQRELQRELEQELEHRRRSKSVSSLMRHDHDRERTVLDKSPSVHSKPSSHVFVDSDQQFVKPRAKSRISHQDFHNLPSTETLPPPYEFEGTHALPHHICGLEKKPMVEHRRPRDRSRDNLKSDTQVVTKRSTDKLSEPKYSQEERDLRAREEREKMRKQVREHERRARHERHEKERQEHEKRERDKLAREKLEKDRLELERREQERRHRDKLEFERREEERKIKMDLEKQERERERLEHEKQVREHLERERARAEQEKMEREQMEQERKDRERREKEKQERLRREKRERERKEEEKREQERLERERREHERLERERREHERLERERREQERIEWERLELERKEKERLELEQRKREQAELERLERERLELEQKNKEHMEMEKKIQERLEYEKRLRLAQEKVHKEEERRAREEKRLEMEQEKVKKEQEQQARRDREERERRKQKEKEAKDKKQAERKQAEDYSKVLLENEERDRRIARRALEKHKEAMEKVKQLKELEEKEKLLREMAEKERVAKMMADQERKAIEKAERLKREAKFVYGGGSYLEVDTVDADVTHLSPEKRVASWDRKLRKPDRRMSEDRRPSRRPASSSGAIPRRARSDEQRHKSSKEDLSPRSISPPCTCDLESDPESLHQETIAQAPFVVSERPDSPSMFSHPSRHSIKDEKHSWDRRSFGAESRSTMRTVSRVQGRESAASGGVGGVSAYTIDAGSMDHQKRYLSASPWSRFRPSTLERGHDHEVEKSVQRARSHSSGPSDHRHVRGYPHQHVGGVCQVHDDDDGGGRLSAYAHQRYGSYADFKVRLILG